MQKNTGIMFVGLCGHLATTAMAGAMALAEKICSPTGIISETRPFNKAPFRSFSGFQFSGWDIRPGGDARKVLKESGLDDFETLLKISDEIDEIQNRAIPGITLNAGCAIEGIAAPDHIFQTDNIRQAIEKISSDIEQFRKKNALKDVVVINLASTEPPVQTPDSLKSVSAIESLISQNQPEEIRPSLIYAVAAIRSGCAYINFTPSDGGFSDGLVQMAERHGVPVMGSDGKTGETLVKSALAPMFAIRNLEVLSWEGYNLLGNMDGRVLQHEENSRTKKKSKDRLLPHILGYRPHSSVSIDYVPSLGDRKTAWDLIHFNGFLNTKMSLQFTWQGCDSVLAAPLVLDLARFAVLAMDRKESGSMPHMASFFKSPWGVSEYSLEKQFRMLEDYLSAVIDQNP